MTSEGHKDDGPQKVSGIATGVGESQLIAVAGSRTGVVVVIHKALHHSQPLRCVLVKTVAALIVARAANHIAWQGCEGSASLPVQGV